MGKWSRANCMGYALGRNEWMRIPMWECERPITIALYLAETYNLKLVSKSDMVLGKEYIVFRKSSQDFHFAKRSADGHWRHKPGHNTVRPMSEKEVFSGYWQNGMLYYNSTPFIFEVQE